MFVIINQLFAERSLIKFHCQKRYNSLPRLAGFRQRFNISTVMSAQRKTEESLLDEILDDSDLIEWTTEAQAIIADVKQHVRDICIADALQSSRTHIYLNVTTLEDRRMCVCLSGQGFRVVGQTYDNVDDEKDANAITFDTPYALLGAMSAGYTQSFGDVLSGALQRLADERDKAAGV